MVRPLASPTDVAHAALSVGEVAALAGVTVRTLHHYDEIGLLPASHRDVNGHRWYDRADLDRLQRILFYRELELGLGEIAALIDGEDDPMAHLRRQRERLRRRRDRLDRLLQTLEETMDARRIGVDLTPEELLEVFGEGVDPAWADEAEERWGGTDAWQQSVRRNATYTKADWQRFVAESQELLERTTAAFTGGEPADGEVAMDLAEEARLQIDRWCYDLSHAGHRSLGTMYVTDPRFTATYDQQAPGLAVWFRDAIHANAERHGATEDGW